MTYTHKAKPYSYPKAGEVTMQLGGEEMTARLEQAAALFDRTLSAIEAENAQPDGNPKTAFGLQKDQLHLVPAVAIRAVAAAFAEGARKYGPFNWRAHAVSSSVYQAAALRHLLAWFDGEDNDPETGASHLGHAMACLAIILDAQAYNKLNDDRPKFYV